MDCHYQKDESLFRNNMEREEKRLIQQAEYLRLAGEKERKAKALRNRIGK